MYQSLTQKSLAGELLSEEDCQFVLSKESDLLLLVQAAREIRETYHQRKVTVHIINNTQNGNCPEDCGYCAQAKTSDANISDYAMKEEQEILEEAKRAYEGGAFRYCMVFSGRGPSNLRTEKLAGIIKKIKSEYPIQICLSAGLIDDAKAYVLKKAGLDRLNHNLNTSESNYPKICSTHTYKDRLNTLQAANKAGIELCSGVIVGMGEKDSDIIDVAKTLRSLNVPSIPVNFYIPIEGTSMFAKPSELTPEYCLKVLCLFRFLNPTCELRVAAGRELHLRSLQVMAMYVANSLFMEGYLNTKGTSIRTTLEMLKDGGFEIESDFQLDEVLQKVELSENSESGMKTEKELRPTKCGTC